MQPLIDNARRSGQRPEEFAPHAAGRSPAVTDAVQGHVLTPPLRPHGRYREVHTAAVLEYRSGADAFEAL